MKKAEFIYKPYLLFLIAVIIYYVFTNGVLLLQRRNMLAILPLVIQSILLILILLRHEWLIYAIRIFSLLCIVPSALRLFGQMMFMLAGATDKLDYDVIIKCLVTLLVGIALFGLCDKSIRVVRE